MKRLSPRYYVLDADNRPVEVDMMTWATWFEEGSNRVVAWTQITSEVKVSTIFLGLDHQYGDGPPLLFETMVFGGPDDDRDQWRWSSYDDAKTNHDAIVRRLRAKQQLATERKR